MASQIRSVGGSEQPHQSVETQNPLLNTTPLEHSRSYQMEMYEASMKGNIIVVMDTGSGKTHVYGVILCCSRACKQAVAPVLTLDSAIIRIKAELERCLPQQLIWFLAPTVALCEQQHRVLSTFLPAVQIRLLIGSDNVDRWSEQRIWDIVLDNFRIIVSTHAVLAEALGHGFVTMGRLALLVFDEAHHCARGHPANKIMTDHYHPELHRKGAIAVPPILGLTASPIIRSKASELGVIERNLNAACRTPRVYRQELLKHVHRPKFIRFIYTPNTDIDASSALSRLKAICDTAGAWSSKSTSLKRFCAKACHVHQELGSWASEYYICESIRRFRDAVTSRKYAPFRRGDRENDFILDKLQAVYIDGRSEGAAHFSGTMAVSEKVEQLIQFLTDHDEAQRYGIVFVEQRATVAVLNELLSTHPMTRAIVKCSTFVGTSANSSRKTAVGEWLDSSQQQDTLIGFRRRERNLIIATSVLEEGIDISACNTVICFNKPPNLKSFIQRRGRARKKESIFILMLSSEDESVGPNKWEALERKMTETYQQDAADRQNAQRLENIEEFSDIRFKIESTGALLTFDKAVAHIYHFCATLPQQPYVDMRPTFHFHEDINTKLITATLTFPNCVDPSVRRASSQQQWRTEKMAVKDAAFQAYIALYGKGLVNDNLLPLLGYDKERPADVETRQALCEVSQTYDPWVVIAREWTKLDILYRKVISIERPGQPALSIDVILPRRFDSFGPLTLYWDEKTTYTVSIHDTASSTAVSAAFLPTMRLITSTILRSVHSSRMTSDTDDFLVLFTPCIDQADLGSWLVANAGEFPASDLRNTLLEHQCGLIREPSLRGAPHILQDFGVDDTIRALALPKRRDFLHYGYLDRQEQEGSGAGLKERKTRVLPVQSSTVDKLSLDFVECSLLIPSILHQLLRRLLALDLSSSLLKDVAFDNIEYIITATNAPSANETTNYQQLEFFGDSVLKFLVSIHLYQAHRSWPEGYLSRAKDQIVANSRLARAGVEAKLDRYIVSEPFTAKKWAPAYVSNYSQPVVTGERTLSTKVLADVVEALIGGAFLAGGLENAAACTSQLLPEISATILNSNSSTGSESSRSPQLPNDYFLGLESFLAHKFRDSRLLKEALTHPSCQNDADTLCYQRLEFVGDTALDMLIISYLTEHAPSLPPGRLHLIKAAMVNAGFLAYLCLKAVVQQDVVDVHSNHETLDGGFTFEERRSSRSVNLCRFMQHQHANIEIALQNCDTRFEQMQSDITKCLKYGTYYPWVLLTSLAHEKFVSDIIESLFGAILIDNACNIQACQAFAEKLGLLDYLRRIVEEDVDLRHPKNILGEIASGRTVEYDVGVQEGTEGYFCIVRVNGMDVVKAFNGSSPDEVTTRAAHAAIGLVKR